MRNFLLGATVAICWGSTFAWMEIATKGSSPYTLTLVRFVVGAVAVSAFVALYPPEVRRAHRPREMRPWLVPGIWASLLVAIAPFLLMAYALRGIDTSAAAIINATGPLWGVAAGVVAVAGVRAKQPSALVLGGLAGGLLGVVVLVGGMPPAAVGPALLVCLLAISYGVGGSLVERTFRDAPPFAAALYANLIGIAVLLPFGIAGAFVQPPSAEALGAAAMAGLLTNGVGYLAYFSLIRRVGAARSLSVVYAVPAVAILIGVMLLGESVGVLDVVGLALISLSLAFVGRG